MTEKYYHTYKTQKCSRREIFSWDAYILLSVESIKLHHETSLKFTEFAHRNALIIEIQKLLELRVFMSQFMLWSKF